MMANARPLAIVSTAAVSSPNMLVMAASQGNQIAGSLEEAGHGLFTYYLLKGLNGDAQGKTGHVTIRDLYLYLTPKVEDAARHENHDQKPQLIYAPGNEEIVGMRLR